MGEAKRRRQRRAALMETCKSISHPRFNLFALGTRSSMSPYLAEEISLWASHCEHLLGVVARDRTDHDYLWVALARDRNGCFRAANQKTNYSSAPRAEEALFVEIDRVLHEDKIDEYGDQGDETNAPLDLLQPTSDLDLVNIYDCAVDAGESDGPKPLSPGHYHTRLAQRLIAALSAPTSRTASGSSLSKGVRFETPPPHR